MARRTIPAPDSPEAHEPRGRCEIIAIPPLRQFTFWLKFRPNFIPSLLLREDAVSGRVIASIQGRPTGVMGEEEQRPTQDDPEDDGS